MNDRKLIPGKFAWFELVSREPKKAQAFYGEVLGWKVQAFPMGAFTYEMVYAGDTMIGGYGTPQNDRQPSHWISYVSVEDVDAAARTAAASGGKVVTPPADIPTVGRIARLADPQGAELCLFKSISGDAPDGPPPVGGWCWNELHTTDPAGALAFYEKVVGFSHRTVDMGPSGKYHIIGKGGVDRGGVTDHLTPGHAPHWLPYAYVQDADAALTRARNHGGTVTLGPLDIPDVGRFGVLQDPTGAALAVLKPLPQMPKP
jgi:predicted enzyme related to lactoylglutathione lyase